MNAHLKRHACKIQIRAFSLIFFGFLSLTLGLVTSPLVAQQTNSATSVANTHANLDTFDLMLDLSLGMISEKELKARLKASGVTELKAELEKKLKELKGDRVGLREVTADQFSRIIRSMEITASGQHVEIIGVTSDRAYLEFSLFLSSESRYVAIVTSKLAELPETILKKLK
jgi:hypothetical protein